LYEQLRQVEPAITLQMDLLSGARDDLERRKWTIRLAHLYSSLAHDVEHAELTLQQARKTWPHDAEVLRALCQLYQNSNQQAALQLLLDRASREARNQLTQGMLELQPFDTLLTIAELNGKQAAAEIIAAARAVLQGRSQPAPGLGPRAMAHRVEKFLLPDAVPPALRALLHEVGSALDRAVAQDLPQLTATPLYTVDAQLAAECNQVAQSVGVESIEFFVSPELGVEAVAHNSSPPQLVFGQKLLALADRPLLFFFLYRGLRAVSAHCCALLRGSGADAQLRLWALLCCFAPDWQPPGMARDLIQPLADKISAQLPSPLPHEATLLASEVIHSFASRATQLNALLERWVMRTALLASGDPWVALRAVAAQVTGDATLPGQGVPDGGVERARFIANAHLARDLLLFCTTDECGAAREQGRTANVP
ncbi:MAG TPA: hypothetical protein VL137_03615, partial [Polyangiaceae bacterium]|nr:hypothetical protein [Polyangiaceae bacterium]